jgi:hypothetical protein
MAYTPSKHQNDPACHSSSTSPSSESGRIDCSAQIHPARWTRPLFCPDPAHGWLQSIGLPAQKQRRLKIAAHLQGARLCRCLQVDLCAGHMPAPSAVQPAQFTPRPSTPGSRGVRASQQQGSRSKQHAPVSARNAVGHLPEPGELCAQGAKRQAADQALEQHATPHRIDDRWGFVHTKGKDCVGDAGVGRPAQTRLNTKVPLVPPKPKLFFTATSIFMSLA